ncbi:hypothetical protein [Shewanella waksmanii]|uniref:hypothetical protein n=1 Tax=Shewanella waksmanii TaxID=213783 RepID=UPI003735B825
MQVQFSNLAELFQAVLADDVSFDNEESARDCINAIAEKCAVDAEVTLQLLWGSCVAEDIAAVLYEKFFYEGYDIDWYDLLRFDFDIDDLALTLMDEGAISMHYSPKEVTNFVESTIASWSNNAERFCLGALEAR